MLTSLARLVADSTEQLDAYQYATVLERAERWFWSFCDDYLELVKNRRYGAQGEELAGSANSALVVALDSILRVFAPFLPFVTEEVWSWWREGSVHRAPWPTAAELEAHIGGPDPDGALALERAALVLGEVRKAKSEGKRPLIDAGHEPGRARHSGAISPRCARASPMSSRPGTSSRPSWSRATPSRATVTLAECVIQARDHVSRRVGARSGPVCG